MNRRWIVAGAVATAVAAGLGMVACTDRPARVPAAPSFSTGPGDPPTTCDFSNITSLVIAYFPGGTRQNTVKDLVTAMDGAADFSSPARGFAFDIMTHMDSIVTDGTAGDAAKGSDLVNALIYCMYDPNIPAEVAHRPEVFPDTFTVELDPAEHGAFSVRGGTNDADAPVINRVTAFSGVSAGGTSPSWVSTVIGNASPERVLVYGRPVPGEPEQYEWKTLPHDASFNPGVVVGFCLDDIAFPTSMVEMQPGGVLAFQGVEFLPAGCSNTASLRRGWEANLASLARFGAELFGPRPLWATVVSPGGLGGTAGGIRSKFKPRDLGATGGVTLTFDGPTPAIPQLNQPFTVVVTARNGTTPVGGVQITLAAFNNNGDPVQLSGGGPDTTDEFGVITFTLRLNKTGAYILKPAPQPASIVLGRAGITITGQSKKFNVKPAK
jgi:hypothetical protein